MHRTKMVPRVGLTVRLIIRGGIGGHDASVGVIEREDIDRRRGGESNKQGREWSEWLLNGN